MRVSEAYENGPRWTTLWPTRDFYTFPKSANLPSRLFNATDARNPGLGLSRLAFFSPANFGGRVWSANDRARQLRPAVQELADGSPLNDESPHRAGLSSGRYWARTSDLRLVEAALSQLS